MTGTDPGSDLGMDLADARDVVRRALDEDLGGPDGVDVTSSATIALTDVRTAHVVARADGVVAGLALFALVWDDVTRRLACPPVRVEQLVEDGARVTRGDVLARASGATQALLVGERTALNLVSRLSGVATHTRRWADAMQGTGAQVLDTRKTTPGLRALEKYAVRCGGGDNKRMGLSDAALVKDNHVIAAGGVAAAFTAVRTAFPDVEVQVECDTVTQVAEALAAGATFLLLDNMGPDVLRQAVALTTGRAQTEATGGLTLAVARQYAETGVDFLSVGELTHSAPVLDLGFDLRMEA